MNSFYRKFTSNYLIADVIETEIRPLIQPHNIPLHLWEDGFAKGDAGTEDLIQCAHQAGFKMPFCEADDEAEAIDEVVNNYLAHLDRKLEAAVEEYPWAAWLANNNSSIDQADDVFLEIVKKEGKEQAQRIFEGGAVTIYALAGKFCVYDFIAANEDSHLSYPSFPLDNLYFFETFLAAAQHAVSLYEEDFEEEFKTLLDTDLKGCEYKGSFRPHHAFIFHLNSLCFSSRLDAGNNYILPDDDYAVWDNGDEGAYSIDYFVSEAVCDHCYEQFFDDEIRPAEWDEWDWEEKTAWIIENSDHAETAFEGWWDAMRDEITSQAFENLYAHYSI